jgi:hypothetical protein
MKGKILLYRAIKREYTIIKITGIQLLESLGLSERFPASFSKHFIDI